MSLTGIPQLRGQEEVGRWSVEIPHLVTLCRCYVKCPHLSTPGGRVVKIGLNWSTYLVIEQLLNAPLIVELGSACSSSQCSHFWNFFFPKRMLSSEQISETGFSQFLPQDAGPSEMVGQVGKWPPKDFGRSVHPSQPEGQIMTITL